MILVDYRLVFTSVLKLTTNSILTKQIYLNYLQFQDWDALLDMLPSMLQCSSSSCFLQPNSSCTWDGCFMLGFVKWVLLCKVVSMYCVCFAGIRLIQRGGLSSWYMLQRWWLWSEFYVKWWGCIVVVWLKSDWYREVGCLVDICCRDDGCEVGFM